MRNLTINPNAMQNVPLVGQPEPDYAIGFPIVIPDAPHIVAHITDTVAVQTAKKGKGDIGVILGIPPKRVRLFSYEEFIELIFGGQTEAEAATGGDENALETNAQAQAAPSSLILP